MSDVNMRGEITLTLAGTRLRLVPEYERLMRVEDLTGKSLLALYRQMTYRNLYFADAVRIILAAAVEPKDLDAPKVGNLIWRAGMAAVVPPLENFLEAAISGEPEKNGDSLTATTTTTESPGEKSGS